MAYHYTDETRSTDPHALPDVEVFEATPELAVVDHNVGGWYSEAGFYYAHGFPGCLWDSDPVGPFNTEAEALAAARGSAGFCPHGVDVGDMHSEMRKQDAHTVCEECPAPER